MNGRTGLESTAKPPCGRISDGPDVAHVVASSPVRYVQEPMANPFLDELNRTYARLHTAKEDAFWAAKMGLEADAAAAQRAYDAGLIEVSRFLSDPTRLDRTRAELARAEGDPSTGADERTALRGWVDTFSAHALDSAEARALSEEIVADEGRLQRARGTMELGYRDPGGTLQRATSVKLSAMLRSEPDEALRKAAWEGMRSIETHVLAHGFLDLVGKRNRLGRLLGGEDFYDGTVRRVERMTKAGIFALLDELEVRTRDAAKRSVEELAAKKGASALEPWNFNYFAFGDVTRDQDPYFPFAEAIGRWGRSFAGLGIDYRGATLVLDLLDRAGKYENGFMHGPEIAWRDGGARHAARIHFTANAIPGMVGSGQSAMQTLFHEGGHAAHFSNVDMPAPCFGQEFAPTSVGFAETQSMFCDSVLEDADWLTRYARTRKGDPMPFARIQQAIEVRQPFAAWVVRAMLAVCYAERGIYELPERDRTPERVLALVRDVERRMLFLEHGAPRPVLAVPHLLAGESSAYYHGYVLAEMAVEQTRNFFLARDGHLVDNPRIGPDLARAYWSPGNSRPFAEFVRGLTGAPLSAAPLADRVNKTVPQALEEARAAIARLPSIPEAKGAPNLNARIRVIHGNETVAEVGAGGFDAFAKDFSRWVDARTPA